MKGLEVVAALKGIVNTTSLNTLSTEDKVAIRSLLDIVSSLLLTKRMPNTIPTTSYGWVVSDLRDLANDLDQIAYYIFA